MSTWSDRIDQSQFAVELTQVFLTLADAEASEPANPDAAFRLARVRRVLEFTRAALQSANAELIPLIALDSYAPSLSSLRQELVSFVSNQSDAHLNNAGSFLDTALQVLPMLMATRTASAKDQTQRSLDSIITAAEKALAGHSARTNVLAKALTTLEERSSDLLNEISQQKGVLASSLASIQAQFQQEQESRNKQFLSAEEARSEDSRKTDIARREQHAKVVDEQRESLRVLTEEARTALSDIRKEIESDGRAVLNHMEGFKGQAERLLGIVGTTTIISGYKREADAAAKKAMYWNVASVVGIVAFTAGSVYGLLPLVRGSVTATWETLVGRIVLSLALGVFGTYAARQAKHEEETERRNRRFELELSSIGPFIAELDDTTRKDLKTSLVNRMFGQPETPESAKVDDVSTTSIAEVVKVVLQNLPSTK
jgi:hypothetical protein